MHALLSADATPARDVVYNHIADLGITTDSGVATALLAALPHIKVNVWPTWIAPIDAEALAASQGPVVATAIRALWASAAAPGSRPSIEDTTTALDALAGLTTDVQVEVDVTSAINKALDTPVTGDATAEEHRLLLDQSQPFSAHGHANGASVATHELAHLREALATSVAVTPDGALLGYAVTTGPTLIRAATIGTNDDGNLSQSVTETIKAVAACPWIDQVTQITTSLAYTAQALLGAPKARVTLPGSDVIAT